MNADKELLKEIAHQLDQWATQSERGGWSTHQVEPMRKLASRIYAHLGRTSQNPQNSYIYIKGPE